MNRDRLEGRWIQLKGRIKERWGRLTDDQIDRLEGQWEQLAGLLQEQYGIARDEARRQLRELETAELEAVDRDARSR